MSAPAAPEWERLVASAGDALMAGKPGEFVIDGYGLEIAQRMGLDLRTLRIQILAAAFEHWLRHVPRV